MKKSQKRQAACSRLLWARTRGHVWHPAPCTLQSVGLTCIAHEVAVRSVEEAVKATGVIPWPRVTAELVLWGWVGVTAEVSGLKGGLCLHAGVTARLDFWDASEDVIEAQAVPDLMDHGVGVPRNAIERWIQDNATCKGKARGLGKLGTLLPDAGIPRSTKGKWGAAQSNHRLLHPMTPLLRAVATCGVNHWLSRKESQVILCNPFIFQLKTPMPKKVRQLNQGDFKLLRRRGIIRIQGLWFLGWPTFQLQLLRKRGMPWFTNTLQAFA